MLILVVEKAAGFASDAGVICHFEDGKSDRCMGRQQYSAPAYLYRCVERLLSDLNVQVSPNLLITACSGL